MKKKSDTGGSQMVDKSQVFGIHPVTGLQCVLGTMNMEPTKTQQQYKDECDINNIVKKYDDTGHITHIRKNGVGVFGDFSQLQDYQGMLDTVIAAQDSFMLLPAEVRTRFRNDPGYLIDFLNDEKNYDEALALGLVNKRENAEPVIKNDLNDKKQGVAKKTNVKHNADSASVNEPSE